MAGEIWLTPEGFAKLEAHLGFLKKDRREEVIEKIKVARGFGDLSENAEYDAAKAEQGKIEAEISELEAALRVAQIIELDESSLTHVCLGAKVKFCYADAPRVSYEYQIVGTLESDPNNLRISNESPIGNALMRKKAGDTVLLPNGRKVKILAISK